jgi:acetyl-CoA acyltransferase
MADHEAWIVGAVRTPIGRHGGALSTVRPDDLGSYVLRALAERTGVDPAEVEDVVFGCANQAGEDNRDVARMSLLLAGWPEHVGGVTVNRLCGSGLDAVAYASRAVKLGEADVFVGGGVESMTRAPLAMLKQGRPFGTGHQTIYDTTLGWRFTNPRMEELGHTDSLGQTAENLAQERFLVTTEEERPEDLAASYDISRERQDAFALHSHAKAVAAQDAGRFDDEIVAVGEVRADEGIRRDTTLEKLAALQPVFDPDGTTTAGNAPGVNDGASCVIVCSEAFAERKGLEPLGTILAQGYVADDYAFLARTPAAAGAQALARAERSIDEVARVEINEAFSSVAKNSTRLLGADEEIVNVNGGAVALGHPIGASGGRIVATMVHDLRRSGGGLGLAAICSGGGQGDALLIEV